VIVVLWVVIYCCLVSLLVFDGVWYFGCFGYVLFCFVFMFVCLFWMLGLVFVLDATFAVCFGCYVCCVVLGVWVVVCI